MYGSTTSAPTSEEQPAQAVRGFARELRMQADTIDSVLLGLRAAEHLDWASPAGRNFRSFLGIHAAALLGSAALLREAAVSMDAYGAALQMGEIRNGSQV